MSNSHKYMLKMFKNSVRIPPIILVGLQEVLGLYANTWMLQDIPVLPKIGPSQNASLATVETNVTAERNSAGGEVPQSSTSTQKEVQIE